MILIIDLSYFVFHRFYATKAYLKISKKKDVIACTFDDDNFTELFKSGFRKTMEKLAKRFEPTAIYLCKDCVRSEIWRNDHYEDYKSRKQLSDFDGRSFDVTFNEILPPLTADFRRIKVKRQFLNIPLTVISNDRCEADDICYILCKRVFSSEVKTVISGDHDYMQLIDDDTEVLDLKLKPLRDKSVGSASQDLILKILVGDKSDNVPPMCTKKHALDLVRKHSFEEIVEMYRDSDRFRLNRLLVDMNQIPENLIEEVVSNLRQSVSQPLPVQSVQS